MIKGVLADHDLRYALTNELHARPFAVLDAPGRAVFLAIMPPSAAAERDPALDRAHLTAFIDRHGGAHPAPDASHHSADFGRFRLKWERHTEFVSYTLYEEGAADDLFQAGLARHFPDDWLGGAPGVVIAAIQVEVIRVEGLEAAEALVEQRLLPALSAESLTCARVLDANALAVGDFRIHEGGFTRFAIIVHGPAGPRRIGRAVQRLIEIETYRTLAMLALPVARATGRRLNQIERELGSILQRKVKDPCLGFITITRTEVSRDLSFARVYYTVYGDDDDIRETREALDRAGAGTSVELIAEDVRLAARALGRITGRVDGDLRQDYLVSDMFFSPQELVKRISRDMTLLPGDIVSCGTSLGTLTIEPGNTVEISIDGIGTLTNTFA